MPNRAHAAEVSPGLLAPGSILPNGLLNGLLNVCSAMLPVTVGLDAHVRKWLNGTRLASIFAAIPGAMHAADVIRRLLHTDAADVALYRTVRLEALREHPDAFGSAFEAEQAQPLSWFAERLETSTILGAFRGAELAGIAGFAIQQGHKRRHKGMLWGMYVRAHARQAGQGRRLIEAILDIARPSVELIQLTVVSENVQARRLYARLGFVEYGHERHALKHGGRYYDEILMAKDLT
jgi:RimJ/RimL family protein N-acetyltransferase